MRSMEARRGFTLVELLVVIAIVGILASMLLPALGKAKATAQRIGCAGNMRQVGQQTMFYVDDFNGYGPVVGNSDYANILAGADIVGTGFASDQRANQTSIKGIYLCPAARMVPGCSSYKTSYILNMSNHSVSEQGGGWYGYVSGAVCYSVTRRFPLILSGSVIAVEGVQGVLWGATAGPSVNGWPDVYRANNHWPAERPSPYDNHAGLGNFLFKDCSVRAHNRNTRVGTAQTNEWIPQ